ncbi:MAG: sulfotransferase [Chloroflexota bacterium]|nr:sulfotransferase [Chloroflexota bacterium]
MPICIAGMHRSGTSMVTKFLHQCGLYLGPDDDLMPPAEENPEGFWENLNFVEINEEILNQLGGGWDCPPPEPDDWTGGRLAPLVRRADAILGHFEGREPWGWKDPRSSLTIPFWKALLPDLRVVVVVRNPLEVALSLRQRNGFSYALGLTLWQITNRRILSATTPADRVVTHFDASFADPAGETRRLLTFLSMPVLEDALASIGSAHGLRHHRLTKQDLFDAGVGEEVFGLYDALCEEAEWDDTHGERATARRHRTEHVSPAAPVEPSSLEIGVGRLARSAMDLRMLRRELEEHRQALQGRQERVEELELALATHESDRAEKDARIVDLERREDELAARVAGLEDEIKEMDRRRLEVERQLEAVEREGATLQRTLVDHMEHLAAQERQLQTLAAHEKELRNLLASAHEQLLHRDAEVIGTLGAALHPHAPGAPSTIYYRKLLEKTKALVAAALPSGVPILVLSGGDEAMVQLDDRPAWHFPDPTFGAEPASTADGSGFVPQLEALRARGAGYLVVPATGRAWLARHADLARHLAQRYRVVAQDDAAAHVYGLNEPVAEPPWPADHGKAAAGIARVSLAERRANENGGRTA